MPEKDFAQLYRASQEQTHAPSELVEATCALLDEAQETGETAKKPTRRFPHRPRWAMHVAACLAIALATFGGAALFTAGLPVDQPQARAYAKTPNLLTAELDDGVVPFALDDHTAMQGWGSGEDALGSFTGLQFTLEGSGISRIQATISRGELYQVTTETYDRTTEEGAAILKEAAGWKPLSIGTGDYLAEYDWVTPCSVDDGLDRNDPNHKEQLRLIKRIGSTIDMPYEDEPLTFGLWFDDMEFLEDGSPDLQSLDGTELTITAEYDDGTFRTQAMTLHDGWFTFLPTDTEQGADVIMAEGPFEEKPKNSPDHAPYYSPMQTLYGKVTSVTNEPHPYSLENANVRADKAPVPLSAEEELPSYGSTLTVEDIPLNERIRNEDDTVTFEEWEPESEDWIELRWSNFAAYASDALRPREYISPHEGREVIAFQNNYEYLSRVRMRTNGWSISQNGTLNDESSLIYLTVDVTNDRDESVKVEAAHVGAICTIGHDAVTTTFATAGAFAAKDSKARAWDRGKEILIEPHETVQLHIAFIVDDVIASAGEVYYALGRFDGLMRAELDEDLDDIAYISLGKLDWK